MSEQTTDALRAWFKRVEPLYPELFNTAYAICGSYSQAENALNGAILETWAENGESGLGFREKLRGAVRLEAMRMSRTDDGSAEFTWPGFSDTGDDGMLRQVAREDTETQRLLMLRYGIGLSPWRISTVTGMPATMVRNTLKRFETRCRRNLPARERNRFEIMVKQCMRRQLNGRTGIPHPAAVYRAFEAEAAALQAPTHRLSRIIYHVVVLIMAVVCAVLFWLFAILVQPPNLQAQTPAPRTATEAPNDARIETTYEVEAPA